MMYANFDICSTNVSRQLTQQSTQQRQHYSNNDLRSYFFCYSFRVSTIIRKRLTNAKIKAP